jgi:hypothetical protein
MAKKRDNPSLILVILIFLVSLFVFFAFLFFNSFLFLEKKEIVTTLTIGDTPGFDLNQTILSFGAVSKGTIISRNLILENNYNFPIKVELSAEGNIKRYIAFEKVVYLKEFEVKIIPISTVQVSDENFGNYSGKIILVLKKDIYG